MTSIDQIKRTLQTHTPAGKDKRHDGCSCFAEALAELARVEAVIEAARLAYDEADADAYDALGLALLKYDTSNLSPSTPVNGQDA